MQTTFIELIKIVHPDHAGDSPYASHDRAIQVIRHRHNPKKLEKLAIEWGIVAQKGSWQVKRRGLRVGDIVTFTKGASGRWAEGLIVKINRIDSGRHKGQLVGTIVDLDDIEWKIREPLLDTYRVKFKSTCLDKTPYTLEDIMEPWGLIPNTSYQDKNKYVYYRKTRYKVYKTSYKRVYLNNKHGVFSVSPKALRSPK